jgi:hypothetical protein
MHIIDNSTMFEIRTSPELVDLVSGYWISMGTSPIGLLIFRTFEIKNAQKYYFHPSFEPYLRGFI